MIKSQEKVIYKSFGEFFRQKRISLGFTLRNFCKRYGYDPGNISKLERNIISPTIDQQKLEGYASSLKIPRDSVEWTMFFDLANTSKGTIPTDIRKDPQIFSFLPAFYRTVRGDKLDKRKINQLLKLLYKPDDDK
jgi:transcriptional regulator with XRE-family HTH domain